MPKKRKSRLSQNVIYKYNASRFRRLTRSVSAVSTSQNLSDAVSSGPDGSAQRVTTINVAASQPRRRHAVVPHRVTYRRAILLNDDMENMEAHNLGALSNICTWCSALYFQGEHVNRQKQRRSCCNLGEVLLPRLKECPDIFRQYLTEDGPEASNYRNNIRALNSLFAMASFKATIPEDRNVGQGHWCFYICGQIYHYTESLLAEDERQQPVLNQYYFVDAAQAIDRRFEFLNERANRRVIEKLEISLRTVNPWIQSYLIMKEVIDKKCQEGARIENIVLAFKENMAGNLKTHNLPESRSDIAAVFNGEEPPFDVELVIYPKQRGDANREIKNLNRMSDPMVYPLLFPCGEFGYDCNLSYTSKPNKKISIREFYRYRLQIRPQFSIIHNSDKLFQQYILDGWCRAEANDLWWYKNNQSKLRVAGKQAIKRMLAAKAAHENLRVGKITILPANYIGSTRHKNRKYLDAMTIVSRLGKPDLFITMTCNPSWPEIISNLQYRQKWQHRPDLVVRVFNEKVREFMDDINNKQIYGVTSYSMYVIEFQKRGLPHAHILVALRPEDKLDTAELIDSVVCARLPNPDTEPNLYRLVSEHQVHRPCGSNNPDAPCMQDGRCKKYYPKQFSDETILNQGRVGQPLYKRPRDGRTVMVGGMLIDNRRIVPYNRYALVKYCCHINFEICGSLGSIKYLHKYLCKGVDCITVQMKDEGNILDWDEIRQHVDCRYVSAMEAAWRLFEFPMSDRTHSVMVLPVHLQDDHPVYFDEMEDVREIVNVLDKPTKLMAYFILNAVDPNARQYKYQDIPEYYIWNDKDATWQPRRQKSKMFGCLVEVSPQDVEKFYLRYLLLHTKGAQSFEDLRTVGGILYESYKDTCLALNLLANSNEYDMCMSEAAINRTPMGLRRLFALICVVCSAHDLPNLRTLWQKYRQQLLLDFIDKGCSETVSEAKALKHISEILQRNVDRTLLDFDLPPIDVDILSSRTETNVEEDAFKNFHGRLDQLNIDQRKVFDEVMDNVAIKLSTGSAPRNLFYIDAPGGTGKTFLLNTILKEVRSRYNCQTVAVAWTGIAASLLLGGKTVHRVFKLPLNLHESSVAGYGVDTPQSAYIKSVPIIVWDEASMSPKHAVHAVNGYLKDLMESSAFMGGKIVVFGGDFRQILPVIPRAHRSMIIASTIKASYIWNHVQLFSLKQNMRAGQRNEQFSKWLLQLGDGRLPVVKLGDDRLCIPGDLVELPAECVVETKERLISLIFGPTLRSISSEKTILSTTNVAVDEINALVLNQLPGETRTYYSIDEYENEEGDELFIPMDYLHSLHVASLPPHELQLKKGAIAMLMRNLDIDVGQCNGARCKILSLGDHLIEVELATGTHRGEKVLLPRIKMTANDPSLPKPIIRLQFPLKLAFAMTINKSQGQTFKRVGIYLKSPCFAHGQLYVAFSRTGSLRNVHIYVENSNKQGNFKQRKKKYTRNIVYDTIVQSSDAIEPTLDENPRDDDHPDGDNDRNSARSPVYSSIPTDDLDAILEAMSTDTERMSLDDSLPTTPQIDDIEKMVIPNFNTQQLAARVATSQKPGTTGLNLQKRPTTRTPYYEDYEDDSD